MAKVQTPDAVQQSQDMWVKIRHEWEKVGLSDRTLADRWGFKSCNSIKRRRGVEGWSRDIESVTTRLVTQAVADLNEEDSPHTLPHTPPHTPHTPPHTAPGARRVDKNMLNGTEQRTLSNLTRDSGPRGRQVAQREIDDARDMRTARGLADVHAKAIADQVEVSDAGVSVVNAILGHLTVILTSLDVEEIKDSRDRLMAINPDKDTMAGHMKAAGTLMEQCVKIKRLALAMDVMREVEPITAPAGRTDEIIKRLDVDTLMKMRQTALEVSQLPATVFGDVE